MILPWILEIVIGDKFITNEENDAKNLVQGMDECECYQLLITKIVSSNATWSVKIVLQLLCWHKIVYIEQFFMLEKHLQLWRPETTWSLPHSWHKSGSFAFTASY